MNVSKLLRFLLSMYCPGIVESGGGGAAADDLEVEVDHGEGDEDDAAAAGEGGDASAAEGEEVEGEGADDLVVTLGDEPPPEEDDPAKAPEWVRELRKSNREKDRRIRELEQKVSTAAPVEQAIVVGDRPKLADYEFDEDKHEAAVDAWILRKQQAAEQQRSRAQAAEQQQAQWQVRVDAIAKAASGLKLPDYEEAVQTFEDLFPSIVQRGIIMGGPEDAKTSALLRYALGKNPKKAKELAAITDHVKFTFAIAKLEDKLKITPRKSAPPPETVVRSSVSGSAAVDSTLKNLQAQADKSGDRTKVAAYLRNKARQAA